LISQALYQIKTWNKKPRPVKMMQARLLGSGLKGQHTQMCDQF